MVKHYGLLNSRAEQIAAVAAGDGDQPIDPGEKTECICTGGEPDVSQACTGKEPEKCLTCNPYFAKNDKGVCVKVQKGDILRVKGAQGVEGPCTSVGKAYAKVKDKVNGGKKHKFPLQQILVVQSLGKGTGLLNRIGSGIGLVPENPTPSPCSGLGDKISKQVVEFMNGNGTGDKGLLGGLTNKVGE